MTVAIVCTGLLGLLLFGLGFGVSLTRGRSEVTIGHPTDPTDPLHKMVRAHGNTAEYAPLLAVLIIVAARFEPASWVLWVMCIGTACRYLIAGGLLTGSLEKANPFRFVGALGTYVSGLILAGFLIASA